MWDVFIFIFGCIVGSFLNVVIDRSTTNESIWWGRSHCDFCKKPLRWFELIPLLSFIIQLGHCRRCHKKLSWQYPWVEGITGISFVYLSHVAQLDIFPMICLFAIYASFLVIVVTDIKYYLIPDATHLVIVAASIGLIVYTQKSLFELLPYLYTGLVSSALFFLLWLVTRGKGIGMGDVFLSFSIGIFLGFPLGVIAFYIAFLTGAAVGVILILYKRKKLASRIQFGPFLVLATWISYIGSSAFLQYWNSFFHI